VTRPALRSRGTEDWVKRAVGPVKPRSSVVGREAHRPHDNFRLAAIDEQVLEAWVQLADFQMPQPAGLAPAAVAIDADDPINNACHAIALLSNDLARHPELAEFGP
jgi:hypothetical protein